MAEASKASGVGSISAAVGMISILNFGFCAYPRAAKSLCDTDSGRRTRLGFLCGREAGRLVRHESRRQAMARVADHLSVEDLEARLRSAQDPTATRHVQVIWLLARGHTIAVSRAVTSFVPRWIEQLLARYNAHGPEALGDLRRRNGSAPSVLRPGFWRGCPSGLRRLRPTVACGQAGKWRPGWRANSGSLRSCRNAAGRRSRRSTGRCRSRTAPSCLGHARGARGVQKRMARPVCKRLMHSDLISLLQRIRPRSRLPAKMEIRASRSS